MAALTIDAAGLRKDYGGRTAVRDLTLQVRRGEAFGFLGPNGAGKSTSIKMLLGLVKPTQGSALLLGQPLGTREVRARIGFLPEHFRFYDWLSATERVGLGSHRSKPLRSFSKGMMQRAGLAQAIVNEPDILFLDEPTSGLDPGGRKLVRDVIREQRNRGATVFLNSHLLGEVEQSCDRIAFIRKGEIVGMHEMGDWQADRAEVEIHAANLNSAALARLSAVGGVAIVSHEARKLRLRVPNEDCLPEVVRCLVESGADIFSVVPQRVSLEDLFLQTMGSDPGL